MRGENITEEFMCITTPYIISPKNKELMIITNDNTKNDCATSLGWHNGGGESAYVLTGRIIGVCVIW